MIGRVVRIFTFESVCELVFSLPTFLMSVLENVFVYFQSISCLWQNFEVNCLDAYGKEGKAH